MSKEWTKAVDTFKKKKEEYLKEAETEKRAINAAELVVDALLENGKSITVTIHADTDTLKVDGVEYENSGCDPILLQNLLSEATFIPEPINTSNQKVSEMNVYIQ